MRTQRKILRSIHCNYCQLFQQLLEQSIIRTFFNCCLNPNPVICMVTELFIGETSYPLNTNPVECFVTDWYVANSSPRSRWSLCFDNLSTLENLDHFERFGCYSMKHKHGTIVELVVNVSNYHGATHQSKC